MEVTAGGLRVRAERTVLVAVTGAPAPVTVDGRAAPFGGPLTLAPGSVLALGMPPVGLRSYVAVRGGVDVPPVLGSRSTDTLSGLGPAPLSRRVTGSRSATCRRRSRSSTSRPSGRRRPRRSCGSLPGPRRDWLDPAAWTALTTQEWTVTADSNRVGLRLSGPQLARARTDELPSEGLVPGALQVPPDGAPVLFLADHPVTGGYPVLAVVTTADLACRGAAAAGGLPTLPTAPLSGSAARPGRAARPRPRRGRRSACAARRG